MAALPEIPRFEAEDSDPGKAKYGPIAYGFKVLIDGLATSTGLSGAQVVGGLLTVVFLGFALVVAAGVVLMRETVGGGSGHPAFDARQQASTQPPPDLPSPLPVGHLGTPTQGSLTPVYGGGGGSGSEIIPVAQTPPPMPEQGTLPANAGGKPWPQKKPWHMEGAKYQKFESGFGTNDPNSQNRAEGAAMAGGGGGGQGRFTSRMSRAAGGYAGQIPGAPELPAGQVMGAQGGGGGLGADGAFGMKKGGKVDGPVIQDKIPDVGQGERKTANPTPGAPTRGMQAENMPPTGTQGAASDVNKIQLDPSHANNIDRAPGVGQSMDNLGIGK